MQVFLSKIPHQVISSDPRGLNGELNSLNLIDKYINKYINNINMSPVN